MPIFPKGLCRMFGLFCAAMTGYAATDSSAQVVRVTNAPRPFSVVSPSTWVPGPIVTGNTRVAFNSPKGTPHAECAVLAIEFKGQKLSQESINQNMAELPTVRDTEAILGASYNNVKVRSIGPGLLAGYHAHVVSFDYSVGTPNGEIWGVFTSTTAAVAPNVSWSVGCGGLAKNLSEARKSHSYWQSELNNFPTNFKFKSD